MKLTLKLLTLAALLAGYVTLLKIIPGTDQFKLDNFGWGPTLLLVAIYIAFQWAATRIARRFVSDGLLRNPAVLFVGRMVNVCLIIPAAALVLAIIPGASVSHPGVGALVILVLALYFASADGAFELIDGKYKKN